MKNKFFMTTEVNDYVTRITGLGGENAYLIRGNERALLFDGLTGVGSLKAFVRELTDLPVFLVLSHGHPDHEGAAFEYGECFVNPDDIGLMYSDFASGIQGRYDYVTAPSPLKPDTGCVVTLDDVLPPVPVKTWSIYDGDVFDLGGITLEVLQVPGHTRGTIVLLDRTGRALYSGDAINPNTLMNLYGSTTIEEYKESVLHLKQYQKDFDVLYGGHGLDGIPASIVDDALMLCDKILDGTDDSVEEMGIGGIGYLAAKRGPEFLPAYGGFSNIVYSKSNIRGKKGRAVLEGKPYVDSKA